LTSACCPRQNEHINIKRVAYNHVTAILQRWQKRQKCVLLLPLRRTFFFPRDFPGTIADTDITNTPPEPFRPTDVPFGGYKTKTKVLGGKAKSAKSISGCSRAI